MPHPRPFHTLEADFLASRDTPRAALERQLDLVQDMDGSVRAFRVVDIAGARKAADMASARWKAGKPLSNIDGMVIGVKDIIDVAGFSTRMNSPIFENASAALQDAPCVEAARRNGAIIFGKTETAEFASGSSAPTRNPHDLERSPGGSSSGSGAAVGAGMVAGAFGTQTQGSILRPASYCGAVGYKPSFGMLPLNGVHPVSGSHDHLGVLAASVSDAWNLFRAVSEAYPNAGNSGPMGAILPARPSRVAVLRLAAFEELNPASQEAFDNAVSRISRAGVVVDCSTSVDQPGRVAQLVDRIYDASIGMMGWDMRWPYGGYALRWPGQLGEKITSLLARADNTTPQDYRGWIVLRRSVQAEVERLRTEYDAILMPAASGPAPKGLGFSGSRSFQVPWTFIGAPAWTIPGLNVSGLPFGMQIAGFMGEDGALAHHAAWLEGLLAQH